MTIKTLVTTNNKQNKEEKNSGENQNQNINVVVNPNVRTPHRNVLGHPIGTAENQSPQREKRNHNGSHVYEESNVRHRTPSKSKSKRDKRERDRDKVNKEQLYQVVVNNNQKTKEPGVCSLNNVNNVNNPLDETFSDYNSGDEHIEQRDARLTLEEWNNRDKKFIKAISERGLIVKEIIEDGACLFRAISLQIYGDQDMHEVIRQQTMDYIFQNREYFAQFVTEDISSYISRKRQNNVHGNHIEIQAMSEIYNRPVELYCYEIDPINIFNAEQKNNGYEPLRLSYQRCSHYNAILNPYNASVGVGLGLAGYRPEDFPEHKQFKDAIQMSEEHEIEQTMFEDKLKTTDWEATNEAIEEQIARESYIQWCREQTNFRSSTSSSTVTSTAVSSPNTSSHSSTNISNSSSSTITNNNNNINNNNNNNNSPCNENLSEHYEEIENNKVENELKLKENENSEENISKTDEHTSTMTSNANKRRRRRPSDNNSNLTCKKRKLTKIISDSNNKNKQISGNNISAPSTSKAFDLQKDEPALSIFYQSLLESSYTDDGNGQLSEHEMLQKALQMSRIDYIKKSEKHRTSFVDEEYDSSP